MAFIQNFGKHLRRFPKLHNSLLFPSQQKCIQNGLYSTKSTQLKVTLLGAMGNTGQLLAMLLKQSPLIDEMCLYDIKPTCSFAMELNHIDTHCKVNGYSGKCNLGKALHGSNVVVVLTSASGVSVQNYPVMFEQNAPVVQYLAEFIAVCCPKALVAVATNPVNSMVPLMSEVMKKQGTYSPNNIFGITTVDVVRSNVLAASALELEPECVNIPVIGGHTETTTVPLLSNATPCSEFTADTIEKITRSVRYAPINISKLKNNGSDNLAGAFGISRFVISLVKGLRGYQDIVECTYVRSKIHRQLKYIATPILLGPGGIMRNFGIPKLSDYENCLLDNIVPILFQDIRRGEQFVGIYDPPTCDPCDDKPLHTRCPTPYCTINPPC